MNKKKILIYPPHHNYKLKNIEFKFNVEKREYDGPLINRHTNYWKKLYDT